MQNFLNNNFNIRSVWAVLLLLGLSACNNDNVGSVTETATGESRVEMIPPQRIALTRAIDDSALSVEVTVDGKVVTMERNSGGTFSGSIKLVPDTTSTILVKWSEDYNDAPLALGFADKTVRILSNSSGQQDVRFESDDFNFTPDDDNDQRSNLDERRDNTEPRDENSPGLAPAKTRVLVRIQLPDEEIVDNQTLLNSITPVASVNGTEILLSREGNSWNGEASVTENSSAFASVTFYQESDRSSLPLATHEFSEDVGAVQHEFIFATPDFDSSNFNQDEDSLSNLDEILNDTDPRDSDSPAQDPCETSNFASGCTFDSDGDDKPDSQETETTDTDGDGRPNYEESALQDNDEDGRNAELDINDEDPCVPSANNVACQEARVDTDGDGKTDLEETTTIDTDSDTILDFRESAVDDEDGDLVVDELDPANEDPCIPSATSAACVAISTDSDGDGKTDVEETLTANSDNDDILDFEDSFIADADDDGVVDELDDANLDPCIPSATSAACVAISTDSDGDGKTDVEETLTANSDNDDILDFEDSFIADADDDGVVDELDDANLDPCIPSATSAACVAISTDSDGDGKTDVEETLTANSDEDDILDFEDSFIADADDDGVVDELDDANLDPCIPSATSAACVAISTDSDGDGKTDVEETLTANSDEDDILDFEDSFIADADDDGVVDELDDANLDPCIPSATSAACVAISTDSDGDGKTDVEETLTANSDNDDILDFEDSFIADADDDGVVDELDDANLDPCIPSATSAACVAISTDSDGDGKTDVEETLTANSDNDDILDFMDSFIADADDDGVVDELDDANLDPCIPSDMSDACLAITDSDNDGKSDFAETLTANSDEDDILDFMDSFIADADGDLVVDELDDANLDPCIPSDMSDACLAITDSDNDGKSDFAETLTANSDEDDILDFMDSFIADADGDLVVDELDDANLDPCIPSDISVACLALSLATTTTIITDSDGL